jgi:energy-coupling factor transporter transmembrane protein EcfT
MTSVETNYLMIGMILIALSLVGYIALRFLRRWVLWLFPVVGLLLLGLLYSVVYLFDSADGAISNPLLFNTYNQILRGGAYAIIIAYLFAFIVLQKKVAGNKHG